MSNVPAWALRLRAERRVRLWTQRDMARALAEAADGRTRERLPSRDSLTRMIRDWEAGRHQPKDPYRVLYSRAFGLPEGDLFADSSSDFPGSADDRAVQSTILRPERSGNIPLDVTSFVGRRQEISEVKRLLSQGRLVTLTGPGGVGKTRLALRVTDEVRQAYPDGVWLVTLGNLSDPGLLADTVAAAVGVQDYSTRGLMVTLSEFLKHRHLLLVLDNCEHLVDACATFISSVLPIAPDLQILATSRQSLGTTGEQTWAVPPLGIPDLRAVHDLSSESHDDGRIATQMLAHSDALTLFTERAQAVRPDFTITPGNVMAVARICRRLDGIPLALELAAVRLRSLSAEQVVHRLDDRFRLLTVGDRAAMPRHQTLQALIDWSYDLCSDTERSLWERASVFAGGFDLAAAEQVCAGEGIAPDEVLDVVDALVDKSILSVSHHAGGSHYRMLETIREYGHNKLAASGKQGTLRRRHRDYYQQVTEALSREWFGPDQVAWLARLQREHANLQAALEFCLTEPGEAQAALAIAVDMRFFFFIGHLNEGRRWFSRALAATGEQTPARADALWAHTYVACLQADTAAAGQLVEECRSLAEHLGERSAVAKTDSAAGWIAIIMGDLVSAIPLLEKALAEHLEVGDMVFATFEMRVLACALSLSGDVEQAIALCDDALSMSRSHGEVWGRSWTLLVHSTLMWEKGDRQSATASATECLRIAADLGDRTATSHALELLAWLIATTDPEFSARLMGAAHGILRTIGAPLFPFLQANRDRCVATVGDALGDTAFTAVFEAGMALTVEDAVAEALNEKKLRAGSSPTAGGERG
jgi:non-specific serine/threonine protein kinase